MSDFALNQYIYWFTDGRKLFKRKIKNFHPHLLLVTQNYCGKYNNSSFGYFNLLFRSCFDWIVGIIFVKKEKKNRSPNRFFTKWLNVIILQWWYKYNLCIRWMYPWYGMSFRICVCCCCCYIFLFFFLFFIFWLLLIRMKSIGSKIC